MPNELAPFQFAVPKDIDFLAIAPICLVVLTGIVALIVEMIRPKRNNNALVAVSLAGLVAAGVATFLQFDLPTSSALAGMFLRDRFALVMQALLILACLLSILFSEGYLREKRIPYGEFYPLILWSTSGAMLMVSSRNLLVIFLGLELLSVSLYVLAGMSRRENRSEESALKYFLLGAFASGFLLYGIAFIYGATGSLNLDAIGRAWQGGLPTTQNLLVIGLGLMLIGFSFKSAFVPFHQWTPDVYQGAPTNVTAFMAAGSKIAAVGTLYRLLDSVLPMSHYWIPALFWIAIFTMTVGNLVALAQKDVKRILAYSSIAHAGYLLVGILAHAARPNEIGYTAVAYYLLAYSLMTIGAFAVVSLVAKGGKEGTRLEDLNGLWRRAPLAAGALVVFVSSLVGIPFTAGFNGKLMIFLDAMKAGLTPLAIVLAVNSIISIAYYLSLVRAAFVSDEEPGPVRKMGAGATSACLVCALGVVLATVLSGPILDLMRG